MDELTKLDEALRRDMAAGQWGDGQHVAPWGGFDAALSRRNELAAAAGLPPLRFHRGELVEAPR